MLIRRDGEGEVLWFYEVEIGLRAVGAKMDVPEEEREREEGGIG